MEHDVSEWAAALDRELSAHPIARWTVLGVSGRDTQVEVHGRWRQRIQTHRLRVPTRLDATEVDDAASATSTVWARQVRRRLDEALNTGLLVWGTRAEAAGATPVIEAFVEPAPPPRDWSIEVGVPAPLGIVGSLRAWWALRGREAGVVLGGSAGHRTKGHPPLEAATVSGELIEVVRLHDDREPPWPHLARAVLTCGQPDVATLARLEMEPNLAPTAIDDLLRTVLAVAADGGYRLLDADLDDARRARLQLPAAPGTNRIDLARLP